MNNTLKTEALDPAHIDAIYPSGTPKPVEISFDEYNHDFYDSENDIELIKLQTYQLQTSDSTETVMIVENTENFLRYLKLDGNVWWVGVDEFGLYYVQDEEIIPEEKPVPELVEVDFDINFIKPFTIVRLRNWDLAVVTSVKSGNVYNLKGTVITSDEYPTISWSNCNQYAGIEGKCDIVKMFINKQNTN